MQLPIPPKSPQRWTPDRFHRGVVTTAIVGAIILYCLGIGSIVVKQQFLKSQGPNRTSTPTTPAAATPSVFFKALSGGVVEPIQGSLVSPTLQPAATSVPAATAVPAEPTAVLAEPIAVPAEPTAVPPTEVPTETAIPSPGETATEMPTATATEVPTEVPTATPTEVPTAETAPTSAPEGSATPQGSLIERGTP